MTKLTQFIAMVFLCILPALTCFAYDGPETTGFFPIGWSGGGDIFAFGYYMGPDISPEEFAGRDAAQMVVIIQNMITDSIIYRYSREWYETSVGDGSDVFLPSPKDAWKQIADNLNKYFTLFDIREGASPLNTFPHHDAFDAEIRSIDNKPGIGLYIKLIDEKEKKIAIYDESLSGYKDSMIQGFVWSPDKKRIAVVIMYHIDQFEEFHVAGCNMKVGFKVNPELR